MNLKTKYLILDQAQCFVEYCAIKPLACKILGY